MNPDMMARWGRETFGPDEQRNGPAAPGDMNIHGDLIGGPSPGEKCDACGRRVNHPRKESSPTSEVDSFRVPPGEKDNSRAVEEVASEHAGISTAEKFWRWKYRAALDAYVLQQPPGFLARAMDGLDA